MLLSLHNVSKCYRRADPPVEALHQVSLEVGEGEFVVVRGPSGCGKTTLLLTAGGLLAPDEGRVTVAAADPYALDPDRRAALRASTIGFVFQQFHLVPYLNVMENVLAPSLAVGAAGAGGPGGAERRAQQLIARFGLADRSSHLPAELSTGERQRVALARALLNEPRLILADEPTGNLDEANAREVLTVLAELAADGRAVLLVTHDRAVDAFAHRTVRLDGGRLLSADSPAADSPAADPPAAESRQPKGTCSS